MSRKANPALIGVFVLGAVILGIIAVLLLAGRHWFQERHRHIMYFQEVGQGLQVGAPVVFLGVRIGTVKDIQLGIDGTNGRIMVPVIVELERHTVRTAAGKEINLQEQITIDDLVKQGLRARLSVQSLLTGQMYVDLDFYDDKPARFFSKDPKVSEIPTIPTTVQELTTMLEDFPVDRFLADVAAISAATNKILSSEATQDIPQRLDATLINLESLTARLDTESEPLLAEARADLVELRNGINAVQEAMARVGKAADRISELAAGDSRLATGIKKAGDELAAAARSLQQLSDDESPTVHHLNVSLQEITRAARALRMLAETLERQPEAIIRGKHIEENN
jgi:paraquat-inducible protein B